VKTWGGRQKGGKAPGEGYKHGWLSEAWLSWLAWKNKYSESQGMKSEGKSDSCGGGGELGKDVPK